MTQSGAGAYLAVFLLMALAFIGIPAVGLAGLAGDGDDTPGALTRQG